MQASFQLDVEHPEAIRRTVEPDLQDSDRVTFTTSVDDDALRIDVQADTLGVLQGAVNTALRLTKLSSKFDDETR
jgi:tRNA threonylcarbamoyladenosine modification (KEOPS) complex  Pcc1 subunit